VFDTTISLWSTTATTAPSTDAVSGDFTCDVVIVGAGFTGLSAALHLAEAGTNVVVIEQNKIGYGASGRSGGQVNLGFKLDPDDLVSYAGPDIAARMLKEGSRVGDTVFGLIKHYSLRCDPQQKGWIKAAHCHAALRRQERQRRQWFQHGLDLELLDGKDILTRAGARTYVGGLFYAKGGSVQPLSFGRELARVALERGARIYEGVTARKLQKKGGTWQIETGTGTITCSQVLLCTNGYTDDLWPGLKKSVMPVRSLQMATEPLSDAARGQILTMGCTLSDMRRIIYYFRLDRDNRLCFGGMGPMRDRFLPEDFRALKTGAERIFPALVGMGWQYHWGGRIAITRDSLPHLHELAPGVLAGLGYNGRGVGMATIMGRAMADLALGKDHRKLPFAVTSPMHFPFYGFRRSGFKLATTWMSALDKIDLIIG
jgi:glycine/D-amino acid oxidase-like deaminating enzyme